MLATALVFPFDKAMRLNTLLLATLVSGLSLMSRLAADDAIPAKPAVSVTYEADLPTEKYPWGTLKWLCNAKLAPGALQTVGIAEILPGKHNPLHFHPNCEEVLYMISGEGTQSFDRRALEMKPGMTIRIPAGVKHNMVNTGKEPIKCLISFSSGDRQTVFLEENPPK
jgi:mannose-6-phosphate isomerase-like protein (cupin superfamily)